MRTNRGAWAIGVMVAVGAVLGSVAVWFHYQQSRRAMEFWGAPQALAIRHAPQVELLRLELAVDSGAGDGAANGEAVNGNTGDDSAGGEAGGEASLVVDGRTFTVVARCDIATARGLVHARHALIVDASFDWSEGSDSVEQETGKRTSEGTAWQYAVRFSGEGPTLTVLLDPDSRRIRRLDDDRSIGLVRKIADAEKAFFERELGRVGGDKAASLDK